MTAATQSPFRINRMDTEIAADPAAWRPRFDAVPAFAFEDVLSADLLDLLMRQAAGARYIDDDVRYIGTRQIESPQRVSGTISLMLGRGDLFAWLEQATGCGPIKALAGRIAQTRANDQDELVWHDDSDSPDRLLGVVINLSDQPYDGGLFELRRKGEREPLFSFRHSRPGSITLFAVRSDLEHRVLPVTAGGPRRVYAGWMMAQPEQGVRSVFG
ncbi:MAG: 2OG-Fe(II) oxygenase [Novosphingobium sp.]